MGIQHKKSKYIPKKYMHPIKINHNPKSNYLKECICGLKEFQHNENSFCQLFRPTDTDQTCEIIKKVLKHIQTDIIHSSKYCRAFNDSDGKSNNIEIINCKICIEQINIKNKKEINARYLTILKGK